MHSRSRLRPTVVPLLLLAAACGGDSDGPSGPVDEGETPVAGCSDGTLSSGALYRICFPPGWNGELVIYAHGYVRPDEPLAIPDDALAGVSVSAAVTGLGYAFATTSYRANGLVADVAVDDLVDLDDRFRQLYRPDPTVTYVVGASEGGLVAALAAELDPARFSGVLAACGPIGDFATQIDYVGDFRVVFDFFFPDVLPGNAVEVPDELRANWETAVYPGDPRRPRIRSSRRARAHSGHRRAGRRQRRRLGRRDRDRAAVVQRVRDRGRAAAARRTAVRQQHPGIHGSSDDLVLNAAVARFTADPGARQAIDRFDVSGDLGIPVVTLHTTGDPIVPFLHESLYAAKVSSAGATGRLTQQSADRYGHCEFEQTEVQTAFATLVQQVSLAAAVAVRP